ncbi:MAG: hypothetical protein NT166_14705 [Candidatus Aminicenantes bacterium]|nr:hypothetical protein [Candidatus Aminicenantes bacterium]
MAILAGSRTGIVESVLLITASVVMFAVGGWLFSRRDILTG